MPINEIKQSIQTLQADYAAIRPANSLRDKTLNAYSHHVLDKLTAVLNQPIDNGLLINAMQAFLTENWALVNGTALSYTALPTHSITRLLCDIAEYIADEHKLNPVEVLIPGVASESVRNGYADLTHDVQSILQTHVLSQDGLCLLPVKLITELDLSPDPVKLGNPYFDYQKNAGNGYINAAEFERLVAHSSLTQAVFDTKQGYELLISDTSTLLGHLTKLCQQLGINMAGALGKETNAGAGAYPAIINFMEYYKKLDQNEKNKIPNELNREINTLLALVTDKTQNINATENVNTCIATRRSQLISTMSGHDEVLNQISLSRTKRESLILEARAHFETAQKALSKALENKTYIEGHDSLNLTTSLLNALNIKLDLLSLNDLDIFKTLTPDEITSVCSDPQLRQQIITQLKNLENWVVFVMEMPAEKISSFLQVNQTELVNAFIRQPLDLSALLISLDVEKCTVVMTALKDRWPDIIKSSYDLACVLQHLVLEQRSIVLNALADKLFDIIKSTYDLGRVLQYLTPEEYSIVFNALTDRLHEFINSTDDVIRVLQYLTPEKHSIVVNALTDRWPDIIKAWYDLNGLLFVLTLEQRSIVVNALADRWPDIIKSINGLFKVLLVLTLEQRSIVVNALTDRWPDIIGFSHDLSFALKDLTSEDRNIVVNALVNKWPEIIKSGYALQCVLSVLTPEQGCIVVNALTDRWPDIIKSANDLGHVLKYLAPEQRSIVVIALTDKWSEIIKSSFDLVDALQYLAPEQRSIVVNVLTNKWPDIIESIYDLDRVLKELRPEQCSIVFNALTGRLHKFISSTDDLVHALYYISIDQRHIVLNALIDRLPDIIESIYGLRHVMRCLTPAQRTIVFDAMKDKLPGIIEAGEKFGSLLANIPPEQRTVVISIKRLMSNLVMAALDNEIKAFASALMSDNNTRIKVQFDYLIIHSKKPNELFTTLSNIEPCWLKKINVAAGLNLTDTQLTSPSDIEIAIKYYVDHGLNNKKTVTQHYKHVIDDLISAQQSNSDETATKFIRSSDYKTIK